MEPWVVVLLILAATALAVLWWRERMALHHAQRELHQQRGQAGQLRLDLAGQEALLRASMVATADMLLAVDSQLRVLFVNPAGEAFFGETGPEATLIAYTRSLELEHLAVDAMQGGDREGLERNIRLGESTCRARAVALRGGGAAIALTDVSEVQRLTRARQDMVANLSHELRTPLTSLRLLADTLLTPAGREAETAHSLAVKIGAEVDVLQQMAQEMLDLAAIESGQQVVRLVSTPLRELVAPPLARLADETSRRRIRVIVEVPEGLSVLADPEQARRAILNVLHNAFKFSPDGGQVHIRGMSQPEESRAILSIQDSGPGIPPAELERVFERFFRGDRARGTPGTGLGLAIARHLLRAHGGRIWAENAPPPESGAIFYLAFRAG